MKSPPPDNGLHPTANSASLIREALAMVEEARRGHEESEESERRRRDIT